MWWEVVLAGLRTSTLIARSQDMGYIIALESSSLLSRLEYLAEKLWKKGEGYTDVRIC